MPTISGRGPTEDGYGRSGSFNNSLSFVVVGDNGNRAFIGFAASEFSGSGTTINSATLEIGAGSFGSASLRIYAAKQAIHAVPTNATALLAIPLTTTSTDVAHLPGSRTSFDVTAVVQEAVDDGITDSNFLFLIELGASEAASAFQSIDSSEAGFSVQPLLSVDFIVSESFNTTDFGLPSTTWRIRSDGDDTNSGGFYDLGGAGVDYSDQAAAQVSLTDLTAADNATQRITSATGGFTAALVGNVLRIASGANFTPGYYLVNEVEDSNNLIVDRPVATDIASGGVGKIGGAFADYRNTLSTNAATITSPLAAGHKVLIRGSGLNDPASADYTFADSSTMPSLTADDDEPILIVGYNGRPSIQRTSGVLLFNAAQNVIFRDLVLTATGTADADNGMISGSGRLHVNNCKLNQAGVDCIGVRSPHSVVSCQFTNTGVSTAGTYAAIDTNNEVGFLIGNTINGWRGCGIDLDSPGEASENTITNCAVAGIRLAHDSGNDQVSVRNNTISGCPIGIDVAAGYPLLTSIILDNILASCTTGITISFAGDVPVATEHLAANLKSGLYNNTADYSTTVFASLSDVTVSADPFTDAASGDYSLNDAASGGALLKGAGLHGRDIGARQSNGGGSTVIVVDD